MGYRVLILAALAAAPAYAGGRVIGKVNVTDPGGRYVVPEVIVYMVGFTEQATPGSGDEVAATITQKSRKFLPDLVAITVGQAVSFPNSDAFLHNVFSQSPARKFDLGSFKKGESKAKSFPTQGVVDVYCNIHPEMAATILVLPNKRHARTKRDGSYAIEGVPPGRWMVFAYARRATKPVSAPVTVVEGQDVTVDLAVVRGAEPPHANKYGERKYMDPTTNYR